MAALACAGAFLRVNADLASIDRGLMRPQEVFVVSTDLDQAGYHQEETREQVIERARQYFLDHATIDMDDLAHELSVSRATLYRVAHSRDQLLGDVLWYFADHLFDIVRKERDLTGVEGVLQVTRLFNRRLARADRLRRFLAAEPHCAARVLFTPAGNVLRRHVVVQRAIFSEAAPAAGPWLTGDLDHLAYLYACTIATGFYADILAGLKPDTEQTERVTRALLTQALA